jgi:hypothetical protein
MYIAPFLQAFSFFRYLDKTGPRKVYIGSPCKNGSNCVNFLKDQYSRNGTLDGHINDEQTPHLLIKSTFLRD